MSSPTQQANWHDLKRLLHICHVFFKPEHKKKLWIVSIWALLLSLAEMSIAAAVIPYIQCLNHQCMQPLEQLAHTFQVPTVAIMSLLLFLMISTKLGIHALFAWRSASLHQSVQKDTVQQLLHGFMHMEWQAFSLHHKIHYFRRCAQTAVDASFATQQCITLISSVILLLVLSALMFWHNPVVSSVLMLSFLLMNLGSQRLFGHWQKKAASQREQVLQHYTVGMTEAFASFREIRVYQLEQFFLQRLTESTTALARHNRTLGFLPVLPRLFLDFSFVAVLLLVVSGWFISGRPIAALIPELIFYAVLARSMLPAMMDILSTRSVLISSLYQMELILAELRNCKQHQTPEISVTTVPATKASFCLENVSFAHRHHPPLLQQFSLEIVHPSWVAITGASGVGKSTLLDLLSGVLHPQQGRVFHTWPQTAVPPKPCIAYLPQHVALIEGSLADNVVFGFHQANPELIMESLQLAQLADVVAAQPEGIHAQIGADGSKLSGGQRQRLALARALYRHPDLLLLDEATSGLDENLEALCLQSIRQHRPQMTVVYITHRRSNLCFADQVVHLNGPTQETADAKA